MQTIKINNELSLELISEIFEEDANDDIDFSVSNCNLANCVFGELIQHKKPQSECKNCTEDDECFECGEYGDGEVIHFNKSKTDPKIVYGFKFDDLNANFFEACFKYEIVGKNTFKKEGLAFSIFNGEVTQF